MRKRKIETIGEVLSAWITDCNLNEPIKEMRVKQAWGVVINKTLQTHIRKLFFREGVLKVYVDSSALASNFLMCRTRIANSLNEEIGEEWVKEISFLIYTRG